MGIWIMSQNEERIIYCIDVHITKEDEYEDKYVIVGCASTYSPIIGHYSSKGKALKVLKMVKNHISNVNYFGDIRVGVDYEGTIETPNYGVFQMPQDEEVV